MSKGYAFIDVETTGFAENDIIQFSAIVTDEDLHIKGYINKYIWTDTEIEDGAFNVHGISKDRLKLESKGQTFADNRKIILGVLKQNTVVGHNVKGYDLNVIKKAFRKYLNYELSDKELDVIDLQERYMYLLNLKRHLGNSFTIKYPSNKEVTDFVLKEVNQPFSIVESNFIQKFKITGGLHNALFDAYCCYVNFSYLK